MLQYFVVPVPFRAIAKLHFRFFSHFCVKMIAKYRETLKPEQDHLLMVDLMSETLYC